jgi:hypothetical protein
MLKRDQIKSTCAKHEKFVDGEGGWGGEEGWVNWVSSPNPRGIILSKTRETSCVKQGFGVMTNIIHLTAKDTNYGSR